MLAARVLKNKVERWVDKRFVGFRAELVGEEIFQKEARIYDAGKTPKEITFPCKKFLLFSKDDPMRFYVKRVGNKFVNYFISPLGHHLESKIGGNEIIVR